MIRKRTAVQADAPQEQKKSSGKGKKDLTLNTLKPDSGLPKGYLSISQVSMYLRCPRQYMHRYIDGIILPPAIALVEGSCHHSAIESNNLYYVKHKENLHEEVVTEQFCDEFASEAVEIPKSEWSTMGTSVDDVINRGREILTNYMRSAAQVIKPSEKPEKKIELTFGKAPVIGFIDCEEKDRVIDYKTCSRVKTPNDADADLQLSFYAKATKKEHVAFCCLMKTKKADSIIVQSSRTQKDFVRAEAVVESVADAIRRGAFPMCDPTNSFPCSEKWCGYFAICKGRR